MFLLWLKVFLFIWTVSVCSGGSRMVVQLQSVNNVAGEEETFAVFKLRLVGRERLLNGTLTFLGDLDNNYEGAIDIYSFKYGEWIQTYVKVRTTACDMMTNYIKRYCFPPDADTNLPFGGGNCMKQGEYYLKNIPIVTNKWPTLPTRGLNKFYMYFMLNGKEIGGFEVIGNIGDKLTEM